MPKFIDLTGQQFGKLTVVARANNVGRQPAWVCKCECGAIKVVTGSNLKHGNVRSCGCLWKEVVPANNKEQNTRHGESGSKLHKAWCSMRYRCHNPNCKSYKNYGGRGITICKEWDSYEVFRDWALANGFASDLSIDRIDVNGNYEPSNCRWVSAKTQSNNTRKNHYLTCAGETHTIAEWSAITGIKWQTIKARINMGWTVEDTLTKEVT